MHFMHLLNCGFPGSTSIQYGRVVQPPVTGDPNPTLQVKHVVFELHVWQSVRHIEHVLLG